MAQFPFIGSSHTGRSRSFNSERSVNLYLEKASGVSKSPACLIGTPGQQVWAALTGSGVRGMLAFNASMAVVVVGPNVYTVTTAGVATNIGTIVNALTPVSMASNGSIIMLVTGTANGYFVNPVTSSVTLIADPDFHGANSVTFIDGYFAFDWLGTGKFQITGLYGSNIEALDFATAEGSPDLVQCVIADHRELWVFGENTIEVYFNSGNSDFPFERIQGAFLETGVLAKRSVARMDNTIYWLAQNETGGGIVQKAVGYNPQRCSDAGVENAIYQMQQNSTITDAIGFTYQQSGHWFYVLVFPTAEQTWVYDANTGEWHERAWRDPVTGIYKRIRGRCMMNFANKILVGDWQNGNVYEYNLNYFLDDGDPIARIRRAPHMFSQDYNRLHFHKLEIDMEVGVGLSVADTDPGYNPQAMLRISNDGGFNFPIERWASFGKIGERRTRVTWRKLGSAYDRVYELVITAPVKVVLIGASSEAS